MPGLSFLSKKSWHTSNLDNQERVWLAEQKAASEAKKTKELQGNVMDICSVLYIMDGDYICGICVFYLWNIVWTAVVAIGFKLLCGVLELCLCICIVTILYANTSPS